MTLVVMPKPKLRAALLAANKQQQHQLRACTEAMDALKHGMKVAEKEGH
jgi:hypothetical protein